MKAVVYTHYGPPDVLQIREVEKPAPGENDILVKVVATTVNRTDNATIQGIPFFARLITGVFRPKRQTPGTEFAGEVEAVGDGVTTLKACDRVFGFDDTGSGAHAEYLVISQDRAVTIPEGIDYEQAAASSEGAHYAYNYIKRINLEPGDKVLVYGASGTIGSAAVQLFKSFGAYVTAVTSTKNLGAVHALGPDRVVDYTSTDFTQDDEQYKVVFDAVGKTSFFKCFGLLQPGGIYTSTDLGFMGQNIFLPLITAIVKPLLKQKKMIFPMPVDIPGSLSLIRRLIEEGKFKPLIDRVYPFNDIVDAYRYVGTGKKVGNVVVRL